MRVGRGEFPKGDGESGTQASGNDDPSEMVPDRRGQRDGLTVLRGTDIAECEVRTHHPHAGGGELGVEVVVQPVEDVRRAHVRLRRYSQKMHGSEFW